MNNRSIGSDKKTKIEKKHASKSTATGRNRLRIMVVAISITFSFVLLQNSVTLPKAGYAAFPGANGKIVFHKGQLPDFTTFELYTMDANGTGVEQLTDNSVFDGFAKWSPDGKKIAFSSTRDGNGEIYMINADGSNPTRLTNTPALDEITPAWSPDSKRIAFAAAPSFFEAFNFDGLEIYVMQVDGDDDDDDKNRSPKRLTFNDVDDSSPAWSPDGKRIAFTSVRDGNYEIYVMKPNGKKQTNLTNTPEADDGFLWPAQAWSPDGSKIAFSSFRGGAFDIWVMNAEGSNQKNLTNEPEGLDGGPAWSPDGTKITFWRNPGDNQEIYVMDADGNNQTNLTNTGAGENESEPDWQPLNIDDDDDDD